MVFFNIYLECNTTHEIYSIEYYSLKLTQNKEVIENFQPVNHDGDNLPNYLSLRLRCPLSVVIRRNKTGPGPRTRKHYDLRLPCICWKTSVGRSLHLLSWQTKFDILHPSLFFLLTPSVGRSLILSLRPPFLSDVSFSFVKILEDEVVDGLVKGLD